MIITTTNNVPGRSLAGLVGDGLVETICTALLPANALAQARAALIALAGGADALIGYHTTTTRLSGVGYAVTATATAVRLAEDGLVTNR